jgi:hypothetical protein
VLDLWLSILDAAHAANVNDRAEVDRLVNEMRALGARGAWDGVDRAWRAALAVDAALVPPEAHVLGAHAAQNTGSMNDCWTRLQMAHAVAPTDETAEWIARIYANYGEVSLRASGSWKGLVVLEALDPTFLPDATLTVEAARRSLLDVRAYDGLLPSGRYRVGDKAFEIIGGPRVEVVLRRGSGPDAMPVAPEPPPLHHEVAAPPVASDWQIRPIAPLSTADWASAAAKVRNELLGMTEVDTVRITGDSEGLVVTPTRPGLGRLRTSADALAPLLAERLGATQVTVRDGRIELVGAFGPDEALRATEVPAGDGGRPGALSDVAIVDRPGAGAQTLVVLAAPGADGALLAEGVAMALAHAGTETFEVVEQKRDRGSIWGPLAEP